MEYKHIEAFPSKPCPDLPEDYEVILCHVSVKDKHGNVVGCFGRYQSFSTKYWIGGIGYAHIYDVPTRIKPRTHFRYIYFKSYQEAMDFFMTQVERTEGGKEIETEETWTRIKKWR